jgi:hypothetical protein
MDDANIRRSALITQFGHAATDHPAHSSHYYGQRQPEGHCSRNPDFAHSVLMIIRNCSRIRGSYNNRRGQSPCIKISAPPVSRGGKQLLMASGETLAIGRRLQPHRAECQLWPRWLGSA